MPFFNFRSNKSSIGVINESDDKVRARRASFLLWGKCLFSIEMFPEEKCAHIANCLNKVGSSLSILRKEVLLLHIFAYHFAISTKIADGNADMKLLQSLLIAHAKEFLSSLNAQKWGGASDLAPRIQMYERAISEYTAKVQMSGEEGNILHAVGQVFYPQLLDHGYEGDVYLKDAERVKAFTENVMKEFLSSIGVALQQLREEKIIP